MPPPVVATETSLEPGLDARPHEIQSPISAAPRERGTFSALRHSAFRLYFGGQLVSLCGTWMQSVAQQIVVYHLTGSQLALGIVACAQGLPTLLLTPFAGVIVERFPRRRLLVGTNTAMMVLALIMAVLMFGSVPQSQQLAMVEPVIGSQPFNPILGGMLKFWHVVLLSFGLGIANALDAPSRLSFLIEMVGKEDLPSSIMLNSIMFNIARILGPALGGVLLTSFSASFGPASGPAMCFLLNGLSFLFVLAGLLIMRVKRTRRSSVQPGIWRPLFEGMRFARQHTAIGPMLVMSAFSSVFVVTFIVLLAPFADKVLNSTEVGTSAMYTAHGTGALIAATVVAWSNRRHIRGRVMVLGTLLSPTGVAVLAALSALKLVTLPVAAVAVATIGFGFVCQFVMTNTLIQTLVPDEFRGRVLALYTMTFFGLTPFGNLLVGAIAQVIDTVPTLLIFGTIGLFGAILVNLRAPQLRRLP